MKNPIYGRLENEPALFAETIEISFKPKGFVRFGVVAFDCEISSIDKYFHMLRRYGCYDAVVNSLSAHHIVILPDFYFKM